MDAELEKRLPKPEDLKAMTRESLAAAFAGESQAAEKYLVFAEQAEEEGLPQIAKLFRAISFAETRHARNHLRVMGGIGSTADNLKTAFDGESFEVDEMYPAYREIAVTQENAQAKRSIRFALKAEMDHKWMYEQARERALAGEDVPDEPVSVCVICGHTVIGDLPDKCPVCAATKAYYRTF
jgi:rubrerythrin